VFIATGAAVFHSAHLGKGSEVRVYGVVHLKTYVAEGATVPVGWVAVGNPAQMLSQESMNASGKSRSPWTFHSRSTGSSAPRQRCRRSHAAYRKHWVRTHQMSRALDPCFKRTCLRLGFQSNVRPHIRH
jgi:carbonic anhydrase/acetyltransferase-like protein (isoleucine patch superfamily)